MIEPPLRDELLDIERLQDHARALAARLHRRSAAAPPAAAARPARGQRPRPRPDLPAARRRRARPARTCRRPASGCSTTTTWSLAEIRALREYLPRRYYAQLPTLAAADRIGDVRAYALAVELVRHSDSRLDRQQLVAFLTSYQTVAPLTIGELWAWPSMLRLALLENLRRLADEILVVRDARQAADRYVSRPGGGRRLRAARLAAAGSFTLVRRPAAPSHPRPRPAAAAGAGGDRRRARGPRHVAATTWCARSTSTRPRRRCWSPTSSPACGCAPRSTGASSFEAVSVVEQVLRRDPAGRLSRRWTSTAATGSARRSRCWPSPTATRRCAWRCARSRAPAKAPAAGSARAAHVGYHLIGGGRRAVRALTSPSSPTVARARWPASSAPTPPRTYLGGDRAGDARRAGPGRSGAAAPRRRPSPCGVIAALVHGCVPFSEVAVALVNRLVTALAAPERLPRLDFADGIPASERTMVIVPTLFTSVDGVRALLEQLEVAALGNLDPHLHFALLSDVADADAQHLPEDAALVQAAVDGIEALNRQPVGRGRASASSCSTASGAGIPASRRGWAGSASAARSRSSTAGCAAPPTPATSSRSARSTCCRRCATASPSTATRACRATPRARWSA